MESAPVIKVFCRLKMPDMKLTDQIAGHENTGHEFARHDKYRMKIDYRTLH